MNGIISGHAGAVPRDCACQAWTVACASSTCDSTNSSVTVLLARIQVLQLVGVPCALPQDHQVVGCRADTAAAADHVCAWRGTFLPQGGAGWGGGRAGVRAGQRGLDGGTVGRRDGVQVFM